MNELGVLVKPPGYLDGLSLKGTGALWVVKLVDSAGRILQDELVAIPGDGSRESSGLGRFLLLFLFLCLN